MNNIIENNFFCHHFFHHTTITWPVATWGPAAWNTKRTSSTTKSQRSNRKANHRIWKFGWTSSNHGSFTWNANQCYIAKWRDPTSRFTRSSQSCINCSSWQQPVILQWQSTQPWSHSATFKKWKHSTNTKCRFSCSTGSRKNVIHTRFRLVRTWSATSQADNWQSKVK